MRARNKERIIKGICERVLRKVTPSEKKKEVVLQFSENLTKKLTEEMQRFGIEADAQVQGSVAKDTWLVGEKDVDIFILLPKTYTKEIFAKVLDVVKALAREKWVEAYAEHPYIEAEVEGYKIDFVPCFKIERAEEAISSVDRTPLHTSYIKRHLAQKVKNEVRLLKRFMRGIDTYGAEIKVGGFSGYICELLILYYNSFRKVLEAASNWNTRQFIDLEGYYEEEDSLKLGFVEPLVIVDPVDKDRNAASAVRQDPLSVFIAASRTFLEAPSKRFFFPLETKPLTSRELLASLRKRGTSFIFVKFGRVDAVPDVLWGQLYKSQKSLRRLVSHYRFNIVRDAVWSDEKSLNFFLIELERRDLPNLKKHLGPPLNKKEDCRIFLKKHTGSARTLSGPRIEHGRWVVSTTREYTAAEKLLEMSLKDGGRKVGMAEHISHTIANDLKILIDEEVLPGYLQNPDFARFLTDYIRGNPKWLT